MIAERLRTGEAELSWGLRASGALDCHAAGIDGAGVTVAVIGSGIDATHPEFDGAEVGGADFSSAMPGLPAPGEDLTDLSGAGTLLSAIVAGRTVGVAPKASIYAVRVLGAAGVTEDTEFRLGEAVRHVAARRIPVALFAVSTPTIIRAVGAHIFDAMLERALCWVAGVGDNYGGGYEWIPEGFARAMPNDPGARVSSPHSPTGRYVVRPALNTYEFPASEGAVLGVAATTIRGRRAIYSATGDQVELCAPGHRVLSALPGGGYGLTSGTAAAAAHAAGVAALLTQLGEVGLVEVAEGKRRQRQRLRMTATADPVPFEPKYDWQLADKAQFIGAGLVHAARACGLTT